ncbi:ATP-binding protein [Streptomyces sp. NPDC001544]|uniref:ATP-binding protein n=1 Tax=Streptomyces sp. NPDC001544 TaxID=3364584 RepID=UPI0036927BD4
MNQEIVETTTQLDSAAPSFTVLLSCTPRGARLARLFAADQLRARELQQDPATHIVAELAANAATHGRVPGRSFRLSLHVVGRILRIEVTDTRGDCLPKLQDPQAHAESGRGLLLVDALADRWGVTQDRFPRKSVWAELQLPPPELAPTGFGGIGD